MPQVHNASLRSENACRHTEYVESLSCNTNIFVQVVEEFPGANSFRRPFFFFSSHSLVIRVLAQVDHDCYQCYTAVKCRTDIPEFGLQFKGGSNPNLHHRIPSTIVPDSKLDMQGVRSVHKHRPPILFLKNWKECSALSGHHQTK